MSQQSILRQVTYGITADTLVEFARKYCEVRDISTVYVGTLIRRAAKLQAFAKKSALKQVLTEDNVNGFIRGLVSGKQLSAYTIKSYRGDLMSLWNSAADEGLVDYPQRRRIVGMRMPGLVIDCYTVQEVESLIAAADDFRGLYDTGVPRHLYWGGIVRFAFETGLRRGDCWLFDRGLIRADGSFRIVQSKTGKPLQRMVRPLTVELMDKIGVPKPFAWPLSGWAFGGHFKLLTDVSGVKRGTFKWLRRASGSYVEAVMPGAGSKALGHTDLNVFAAHYDAQIGALKVPLPPEITATPERAANAAPAPAAARKQGKPGHRAIATRVVRIRAVAPKIKTK